MSYGEGYFLCCGDYFTEPDVGDPNFYLHDDGGQGLISSIDYPYTSGLTGVSLSESLNSCRVTSDSCGEIEHCVFRMSSENNSFVSDCVNDNLPLENSFDLNFCCAIQEVCDDNIDNSGDGLIDCASPTCHPSAFNAGTPQECTGNIQTSDYCLNNPNDCSGPEGLPYYCSYGRQDDPAEQPQGFCCPAGEYAEYNSFTNAWECIEPDKCGIDASDFSQHCFVDFETQTTDWFSSSFDGNIIDWCVSNYPNFYDPLTTLEKRSSACCFVEIFAVEDYYVANRNVKIYG